MSRFVCLFQYTFYEGENRDGLGPKHIRTKRELGISTEKCVWEKRKLKNVDEAWLPCKQMPCSLLICKRAYLVFALRIFFSLMFLILFSNIAIFYYYHYFKNQIKVG